MAVLLNADKVERIEREAVVTPLHKIAAFLQETLGQKPLTAYVATTS